MEETAQEYQRTAQNISDNLNKQGHPVGVADVIPQNAQTPMPQTKDLSEVGGEVVGEDLAHVVGTTVGDMTTGASRVRTAQSKRFLGTLVNRLLHQKGPHEIVVEKVVEK